MATGDTTELYDYRTISISDGVPTRTRGIYVEGLHPEVAILVPNLPQYRDGHPEDADLLVRNITPSVYGNGALVQYTYAVAATVGGSIPPVNTYEEGFIGKDVSFEYADIDVPLFKRGGLTTTDAEGLPISLIVFEDYERGISFRKRMPYYSISLGLELAESATLQDVFAITDSIVAQTDKIHTIDGRRLLFACDGIDQQGATTFNVSYRWTEDPGIPNTLAPLFEEQVSSNLGRIGTVIYPYADATYMIPPFQGVRIDGAIDPTDPPAVTYFELYKEDPDGWLSLPGFR